MTTRTLAAAATFAFAVAVAGCGESPTTTPPAAAASGLMLLTVGITPDPPTTGQNTMLIDVKRPSGAAVAGAQLKVTPEMPAHGHGSTEVPRITDEGEGHYRAFPVTFQMPGAWRVTIDVTAGDELQSALVDYDVR